MGDLRDCGVYSIRLFVYSIRLFVYSIRLFDSVVFPLILGVSLDHLVVFRDHLEFFRGHLEFSREHLEFFRGWWGCFSNRRCSAESCFSTDDVRSNRPVP